MVGRFSLSMNAPPIPRCMFTNSWAMFQPVFKVPPSGDSTTPSCLIVYAAARTSS